MFGHRVHRRRSRSPTCTSTRSSRRPTGGACRSRSAPASTRSSRSTSTAPTPCASACSRCPRHRTCALNEKRAKQGRDLANKLWNASRLILLTVADGRARRRAPEAVEDRWIVSRLERADRARRRAARRRSASRTRRSSSTAPSGRELCDWYLELVKPRLYEEDNAAVSARAALRRSSGRCALLHPVMPFVTEEIWSLHARASAGCSRRPTGRRPTRADRRGGRGRDRAR